MIKCPEGEIPRSECNGPNKTPASPTRITQIRHGAGEAATFRSPAPKHACFATLVLAHTRINYIHTAVKLFARDSIPA